MITGVAIAEIVAKIENEEYTSLDAAFTAVTSSGGTLSVLQDTTLIENVNVTNNVIVEGNNKIISIGSDTNINISNGGSLTFNNLIIDGGTTQIQGYKSTMITVHSATLNLNNSIIRNRNVEGLSTFPNIIGIGGNGTLRMTDSTIKNCRVADGSGGGISAVAIDYSGGNFIMYGGEISECGSSNGDNSVGGAFSAVPLNYYAENAMGNIEIHNAKFDHNSAGYGGGIYALLLYAESPSLLLDNVTFSNNQSIKDGGAIVIAGVNGTISKCSFNNNIGRYGGAIYEEETSLSLSDNIVLHNNAEYGGGLFKNSPSMTLTGINIICNNTASSGGADIFNDNGTLDLSSASAMRQTFQSTSFVIDGWYSDASPRWSESRDTYLGDSYSVTGRKGLIAAYTPYDEIEVVKIWNDGNNLLKKRPESLTITLTDAYGNPISLRAYDGHTWTASGEDAKVILTATNADSSDPNKWVGSIGPLMIAEYSDAATYKLQEDVGGVIL